MDLDTAQKKTDLKWHQIAKDLLPLFAISRLCLLLVVWASQIFDPASQRVTFDGLPFFTRLQYLWTTWDSTWYLSIVNHGYLPTENLQTTQSNVAFFPFYPFLVRTLTALLPTGMRHDQNIFLLGVILSNVLFLLALIFIYQIVIDLVGERQSARRTVIYLLIFPTSHYFSIFYTESTYLFFVAVVIWSMARKKWRIAGLMGGLVVLTRPPGMLIALPMLWQYMADRRWNLRKIDGNLLWLGLVPLAAFAFFVSFYGTTGEWIAPILAQKAWAKQFIWPWANLAIDSPVGTDSFYILRLSQIFLFAFTLLSIIILFRLSVPLGLFSLLQLAPQLLSGSFVSSIRYCGIVFPVFILLAIYGKRNNVDHGVIYTLLVLQTLILAAWSEGYWIV